MKNNWKEEFDKEFITMYSGDKDKVYVFIESLLAEQKKELVEEISEIFIDSKNIDYDNGYTEACKDISNLIKHHD